MIVIQAFLNFIKDLTSDLFRFFKAKATDKYFLQFLLFLFSLWSLGAFICQRFLAISFVSSFLVFTFPMYILGYAVLSYMEPLIKEKKESEAKEKEIISAGDKK